MCIRSSGGILARNFAGGCVHILLHGVCAVGVPVAYGMGVDAEGGLRGGMAHAVRNGDGIQVVGKEKGGVVVTKGRSTIYEERVEIVSYFIDNGPMEGLWGILKCEMYYLRHFETYEELVEAIEQFI